MKFRFKPNDTVIYGGQGACTLLEVAEKDFGGDIKSYYVLSPAFSGSSVFYVPVDSDALTSKMRPLKDAATLRSVVSGCETLEWIAEDRPRQSYFRQVVDGGGTEQLVASFRLLCSKQKELTELGKKLRAADERSLREIERLLLEEFSFSFEIEKCDLEPFVFGKKEVKDK